jgi:hypothetical protein
MRQRTREPQGRNLPWGSFLWRAKPKLFELTRNAAERAVELCAKGVHDGDNRGGYAGGNEAVFNGGGTSLIIHETQDKLSHGQPPLRYFG